MHPCSNCNGTGKIQTWKDAGDSLPDFIVEPDMGKNSFVVKDRRNKVVRRFRERSDAESEARRLNGRTRDAAPKNLQSILNDIVRRGYLEDRSEYMEEDLEKMYHLTHEEAVKLRQMIAQKMRTG
jgi:hypothetical protein